MLDALTAFDAASVRPFASLVFAYGARLWRPRRPWDLPVLRRRALERLVPRLDRYRILIQGGRIRYQDIAVEGQAAPKEAREALAGFLQRHRRLLHNRLLRRLDGQAEDQMWALLDLVSQAYERKEYETAISLCSAALGAHPHFGLFNNRGIARYDLGKMEAAIDDYDRAIELNPEDATAYNNRGFARSDLGDLAAAIDDFDRAIALNPEDATAYFNKACALALMGQGEEACVWLERAIGLDREYREKAKKDSDFDGIREEAYFRALVGTGD